MEASDLLYSLLVARARARICEKWASVGAFVPVAAGVSEVGVSLETLDQILHVGYLE